MAAKIALQMAGDMGGTPGSPDAGRRSGARHDMNVRLYRRFVEARHWIVIEVGLLHPAVGGGDFAHQRDAGPEHRGAFELSANAIGMNHLAGVESDVHARNPDLSVVHFHFHHRRDISEEAAVNGDAQRAPVARLLLRPAGLLGCDFDHAPHARDVEHIRIGTLALGRRAQVDLARLCLKGRAGTRLDRARRRPPAHR